MRITDEKLSLDPEAVRSFFDERAKKAVTLGPIRAVIYQDQNPDLANERHQIEQTLLLEKLDVKSDSSVLDLGCGTGRWATTLLQLCNSYVGVDFSLGLLEIARQSVAGYENKARFIHDSVASPLRPLLPGRHFDRILSLGVMIYLNDQQMVQALSNMAELAAPSCRIVLREPVGKLARLTLRDHFSSDMSQYYNAIYREEREFLGSVLAVLEPAGFSFTQSGNMYNSPELNNRAETIQKWFVFER